MLPCQNFGRCHEDRLPAALHGDEHCRRSADRFATADIADYHAAHGRVGCHVMPDLADDALLRAGQAVGELCGQGRDVACRRRAVFSASSLSGMWMFRSA